MHTWKKLPETLEALDPKERLGEPLQFEKQNRRRAIIEENYIAQGNNKG